MLPDGKGLPRDVYLMLAGENPETYGFMVRNIERSSAPEYAPRFGTGKSDETDLSLLKADTFTFGGGQYQRKQKDGDRNSILGGYYNRYAEQLEPYRGITYLTSSSTMGIPTAETYGGDITYVATRVGSTNRIAQITASGTVTWLTLPAPLATSSYAITDMKLCKGYLFVASLDATGNGNNMYRYNTSASTWQDVGGKLTLLAVLRGRLYGVSHEGSIWLAPDVTVTTIQWQKVQDSPGGNAYPKTFYEFNGALWLAYQGETCRFDGVNLVNVLNHETLYAEVYNGAVFYVVGKWLYRFNGSVVEKLQYFEDGITALRADLDNLYMLTGVSGITSGYDNVKDPSEQLISRCVYFDGEGFYTACERYSTNPESGFTMFYYALSRHATGVVVVLSNPAAYGTLAHTNPLSTYASPEDGTNSIFTSEIDNGFPNNWKSPAYLDISAIGSYSLTVDVQLNTGTGWGNWINLCTAQSTSTRVVFPIDENYLYKAMRVRVQGATSDAVTLRYTLQPRQRVTYRIDFVLPTDDPFKTKDRRNTAIDDVNITGANHMWYHQALMRALHSKVPIFLFGSDYSKATSSPLGTGTGSLTLAGSAPLEPVPLQADEPAYLGITNSPDGGTTWEVISVQSASFNLSAGSSNTAMTCNKRGIAGGTVTVDANTIFAVATKLYCTRLISERIVASDPNHATGDFSNTERIVSLEFIEV